MLCWCEINSTIPKNVKLNFGRTLKYFCFSFVAFNMIYVSCLVVMDLQSKVINLSGDIGGFILFLAEICGLPQFQSVEVASYQEGIG